jgi:cystathionine beta-lyase/cystathionine gamma-synthase
VCKPPFTAARCSDRDVPERYGVRSRFASIEDLAEPERLFTPATKLLWFESPINPTLRCVDIAWLAAACRAGAVGHRQHVREPVINSRSLGVDLVMHSATKYLNGLAT